MFKKYFKMTLNKDVETRAFLVSRGYRKIKDNANVYGGNKEIDIRGRRLEDISEVMIKKLSGDTEGCRIFLEEMALETDKLLATEDLDSVSLDNIYDKLFSKWKGNLCKKPKTGK